MIDDDDDFVSPLHRPVLREAQRDAIAAVEKQRWHLQRQIKAARITHEIYIRDLRTQLAALPSKDDLARQYGVSRQLVLHAGRGKQYRYKNVLDEREQRA